VVNKKKKKKKKKVAYVQELQHATMSIQQSEIWQLHLSWELREEEYYLSGQEYGTKRAHCLTQFSQHFLLHKEILIVG